MRRPWTAALTALLAAGCGGSGGDLVPVSGTVRVDGQPVAGAAVTFLPDEGNRSHRGSGVTGPDGRYQVMGPQGQRGLAPGAYRVTVSRPLRKDGSLPPAGMPPIESDAVESLPVYSSPDHTPLRAAVEPGKPIDFDLTSGKKK